jgi:hypothetical protein
VSQKHEPFRNHSFVVNTQTSLPLGPVVQSTISANPGLNFNLLFLFMHFCSTICFKTSEKKTFIGPDKISEEIFPSL